MRNGQKGGIEFTLIAIIVAVIGLGIAAAKITHDLEQRGIEKCQAQYVAAQKAADAAEATRRQEAENHITDMEAAFEAGEEKARQTYVQVATKGAANVQKYSTVFQNPQCVLPDESLRLLNEQRGDAGGVRDDAPGSGDVYPAPSPSAAPSGLPPTPRSDERQPGDAVSGRPQHHRPLGAVQPEASTTGGQR